LACLLDLSAQFNGRTLGLLDATNGRGVLFLEQLERDVKIRCSANLLDLSPHREGRSLGDLGALDGGSQLFLEQLHDDFQIRPPMLH
jgi:hypothetical protein